MAQKSAAQTAMEASGLMAEPERGDVTFPNALQTNEERSIYRALVESNPSAHLFSRAVESLLVQMVRHQIMANKLAEAIRATNDPKLLVSLAKSQKDESQILATLSQKMKMTPASIAGFRGEFLPKNNEVKPWEWDGS